MPKKISYYANANVFVTEYRKKYIEQEDLKWNIHVKEMDSLDKNKFKIKVTEEVKSFKEKMLPLTNEAKMDTLNVRDTLIKYMNEKLN